MNHRYQVVGSHPINVASGYYVCGEVATLTPDEATTLQRAGAVTPIEDPPASVGGPRSRAEARAADAVVESEAKE